MRADLYLFTKGLVKSRQKAKTLIEDGNVTIDGKIINKPSFDLDEGASYDIKVKDPCPYVSRGGLKLEKILDVCNISVDNKVAIDIGASTGGFTHCLLLRGAKKVFAVDSGTGQLDSMLLNDERVVSIENYNARNINIDDIGESVDIITSDVSFISQIYIIGSAVDLLKEDGLYISLIKPQFEVGKDKIGKGGIVKNKSHRMLGAMRVIDNFKLFGYKCIGFIISPITGGDGNVEYVAVFSKNGTEISEQIIKKTVLN